CEAEAAHQPRTGAAPERLVSLGAAQTGRGVSMTDRPTRWVAVLFCLASGTVHSQDVQDLQGLLDTNVVTAASQTVETAEVAPAISSTITSEQLRRYGLHTIEEAVNFLALSVSSSGRNFHARPAELGARGVAIPGDQGNHVLLLVNGHHVNEPGLG